MFPAKIVLQSGEEFEGLALEEREAPSFGEIVFTTGMTGYVESLTDPSYAGQILTFTYPLIGNYGVPKQEFWESKKIYARGVIISNLSPFYYHFQGEQTLAKWLSDQGVPLVTGVDTRALTKRLRTSGVALGAIITGEERPSAFPDPHLDSLVAQVSAEKPEFYGEGNKRVIVIDCGMKENILRSLLKLPISVKRVPYDYDFLNEDYDGLLISNGPGDPIACQKTISLLAHALKREKPIFGICLGAQLLALAVGAKTFKLRYGHRGHNQPCIYHPTGGCFLTAQNHGYAIDETSLPKEWKVTFRNINDHSVEGIAHDSLPFFAVQFHPEATPGPTDTQWLFDKFYEML
jgi:carbamoyl-phosphate synthase small subunit